MVLVRATIYGYSKDFTRASLLHDEEENEKDVISSSTYLSDLVRLCLGLFNSGLDLFASLADLQGGRRRRLGSL